MGEFFRTPREILFEVGALRRLRALVPPMNGFGESNVRSIDAQIEVLEKNLSERRVDDLFGAREHLLSNALEAVYWRNGDNDDAPSAGWQDLVDIKAKPKAGKRGAK